MKQLDTDRIYCTNYFRACYDYQPITFVYFISRFYRAISYRQFVRFVWEYIGHSNRVPLPCCVYNTIRRKFPHELGEYRGFEEEEEEEEESGDNDQLLEEDI